MSESPNAASDLPFGDMHPEEFRARAHEAVDWMADYLAGNRALPVLAPVAPGEIAARLPTVAPRDAASMEQIFHDFQTELMPGITHWNHPGFFAYFGITASGPGIIGEMLAATLNVNAMLWRTSPAATELEERTLDWLRQMMGLPDVFRGHIQDTASISSLVAIAAARDAIDADADFSRYRLYCSEEAHSSIQKAGITIGIGREGTRRIRTDHQQRMDVGALRAAIAEDRAAGLVPFCLVATVGTTSTTRVDPVPEIAAVAEGEGLWLHVDAAYGGAAALLPEMRWVVGGCDRADSLVVNPHKWLFVPIDCSALFLRDPDRVRRAFSLVPEYLTTPEGESVTNLMDYGPALGRRFRSLKMWMTLRYFGQDGIARRIRHHIELAREFGSWVGSEPDWEMLAPVTFSVAVFRFAPDSVPSDTLDGVNEEIVERVNASGDAFLSHTRVSGRYALRLAIGNLRTERRDIERAWELLREFSGTALKSWAGAADTRS